LILVPVVGYARWQNNPRLRGRWFHFDASKFSTDTQLHLQSLPPAYLRICTHNGVSVYYV